MGTLAELWDAPQTGAQDVAPKKSSFSTYKSGTEIGPAKSTLADLWDATETIQAAEQPTPKQGNMVGSMLQKAFEAKQAIPKAIAGNVAGAIDMLAGVPNFVGYGVGRAFGLTPEEAQRAASKVPEAIAQPVGRLTGLAETEAYKTSIPVSIQNYIGEHLNESAQSIASKFKVPVQDVQAVLEAGIAATGVGAGKFGKGVVSAAKELAPSMPKVRIETVGKPGAMQSGGSAVTSNQAMLQEAIGRASPELANELKGLRPEQINKPALENQLMADTLPVPVRLTKGQALQDPSLISFERNERGMKGELAQHYNEQNKALQENANLIKQKTGEGTFETDFVANSERAIEAFQQLNKDRQTSISDAYTKLDDLGAGKIEVDSKTFAQNAKSALTSNEDIDFLPSTIKTKVDSYLEGKPMNFAQYENLRTQIARETRKAQSAQDGNAVHALTLVRGELEKLPLIGETAEAKVVADQARSLAKQEFDLLDKTKPTYNKTYADIVNGGADSSNFIPQVVFRSKNVDFAKALDMLSSNPDAVKQLRSGAMDYMIRESTDKSGNFNTGKFTGFINNLDVNKKLTALFGEDAQVLKDLAKTGQLIEARPRGSFVNESNTMVGALGQYAKGATEHGVNIAAKGLPIGTIGRQFLEKRSAKKQVKETLKPGAGIQLKDIGKE
jgi:hypothetical protein